VAVRRELVPLGLALLLLGGVGAMAVQTRRDAAARADARARPASPVEAGSEAPPGDPFIRQRGAPVSALPPAMAPEDMGALPLRTASLPAPIRDRDGIRRALRARGGGTYIGDVLAEEDSVLSRWPDRRSEALKVWVQPVAPVPSWDSRYPAHVRDVFPEWSAAGFPLRFLHVVDSASADLHVRFTTTLPGRQIGVTSRHRDQHGWIVAATVTIATEGADGQAFPASLISGIARHEVGHALGLGHARDRGAVMYPEAHTTTIAAVDRATLHLLYSLPPGSVR
jgi:hypothetical protein